jgi:hypothetical protein
MRRRGVVRRRQRRRRRMRVVKLLVWRMWVGVKRMLAVLGVRMRQRAVGP